MPTFETQTLGVRESLKILQEMAKPNQAMKIAKRGLRAAGTIMARGIRKAVPPTKTDGHSRESITKAIGSSVKQLGVGREIEMKVGIGVGKKRGSYRPTGIFLAVGTVDRYSGMKTLRQQVKRRWSIYGTRGTGKPVRFRGRVTKYPFVQQGVDATIVQARLKFEEVVFGDLDKAFRGSLSSIQ
ncbi:HK97 gp10 family phage protein [Planctomyces sp. SH-PL14]|uniref:HK97 gp10 family phage protein n=1 Tax=Planctomyces sp. SH-PL14 TaxID=1632864 RepID=UPI00078BB63F|nr:HK97 gp10 family phage protein [Planctomyces sp. SH-PL14]AMV20410.1 hypothetical protein VT03_21105 [Planctomyces sp. SH-PL14]